MLIRNHLFIIFFFFVGAGKICAQTAKEENIKFLNFIKDGNWDAAESLFAPIVKTQINTTALKNIFDDLKNKIGVLKSFDTIATKSRTNKSLYYIGHFASLSLAV